MINIFERTADPLWRSRAAASRCSLSASSLEKQRVKAVEIDFCMMIPIEEPRGGFMSGYTLSRPLFPKVRIGSLYFEKG